VYRLCAGGFRPRSLTINDSAKLAPLDPAAFWLGPTCVVRTRRASGHSHCLIKVEAALDAGSGSQHRGLDRAGATISPNANRGRSAR